ncbi:tetratricopeptide repeat domain-containing protein [Fusarium globosum]|uniref:Tetratricopeptide repeat domain-containing protein n=1 Tax=Fusarium globosum TaxID=78864 RepID=A0A8H6CXC0_9HYPO|nr:tetratricopeptide repeat domain-containing protein [Fusarium globosum]
MQQFRGLPIPFPSSSKLQLTLPDNWTVGLQVMLEGQPSRRQGCPAPEATDDLIPSWRNEIMTRGREKKRKTDCPLPPSYDQGHSGKRVKALHDDPLSSRAEADTIILELTPLFEAATNGDNETIKELLQSPDISINQPCFGKTALEASLKFRHESTALLLMDLGAELYFKDGSNALCAASYYGLKKVAQKAMEKGLDVNEPFLGNRYPILPAVKGGHADMVEYLLQQGAEISRFEVFPNCESVTENSKNPFNLAWYWQRHDIFLLLLDAALTHECRKAEWVHIGPLPPLSEGGPRERLAERLTIWLQSRSSKEIDDEGESDEGESDEGESDEGEYDEGEYEGPDIVISRTLKLVFGLGIHLRGDNILVGLLIEKNAPLPEFVLHYLRGKWEYMIRDPYVTSGTLRLRPTVLEIAFTALPLIQQSKEGDHWLIRVANALKKEGLPLTSDNLERKLGQQWYLMQTTIPD